MRAVQPAISTGGQQLVDDVRREIGETRARRGCREPRARRVCRVAAVDTAGSIGIRPTSGAPITAASASPPPEPKIAWREPSGATNSLMFSTTPSTLR